GVGECRLQFDGSGGGVHAVVDEGEAALAGIAAGSLEGSANQKRSGLHALPDPGQKFFRNGEGEVDGLDLVDADQLDVGGLDETALFDQNVAGAAVDRGVDAAISEVDARFFEKGL